jgi:hypothetical protein
MGGGFGGGGGGGGGGGDEIFNGIGREGYEGGGGANFIFAKGNAGDFLAPNAAGDAPSSAAVLDGGGEYADATGAKARLAQGQRLDFGFATESGGSKSWLLDRVGRFRKDMCQNADEGKGIGVCENLLARRQARKLGRRLTEEQVAKKEGGQPGLTAPLKDRLNATRAGDQNL